MFVAKNCGEQVVITRLDRSTGWRTIEIFQDGPRPFFSREFVMQRSAEVFRLGYQEVG